MCARGRNIKGARAVLLVASACLLAFAASFVFGYVRGSALVRKQCNDVTSLLSTIESAKVAIEKRKIGELEVMLHDFNESKKAVASIEEHSKLIEELRINVERLIVEE